MPRDQFLAVEFFPSAVLFDDQGRRQNWTFVGAEALSTIFTFSAAANAAAYIVRCIDYPGAHLAYNMDSA